MAFDETIMDARRKLIAWISNALPNWRMRIDRYWAHVAVNILTNACCNYTNSIVKIWSGWLYF